MIPSPTFAAIAREKATIVRAFKGHSEVVALRIERISWVREVVTMVFSHLGNEDIKSS